MSKFIRKKVTKFNPQWKTLIDEITGWKNKHLYDFCLNNCDCECCHMEHKWLSEKQVRLIFNLTKKDSLYKLKNKYGESVIRKDRDKTFSTDLCFENWCPAFEKEKNICKIHKSELKPDYCDNFPFYYTDENGEQILEIAKCPAIKSIGIDNILKTAEKNKIWVRTIL